MSDLSPLSGVKAEVGLRGRQGSLWTHMRHLLTTVLVVTAGRIRGRIESILDWAKARGYRDGENPARWRRHLDKLLPAKGKISTVKHVTITNSFFQERGPNSPLFEYGDAGDAAWRGCRRKSLFTDSVQHSWTGATRPPPIQRKMMDIALAHVVADKVEAAYRRGRYVRQASTANGRLAKTTACPR